MAATQVEPMTPGTTATAKKAHALLVLYASQTGNAEYIAKNIHQQAQERGFESACLAMDEHEKVGIMMGRSCRCVRLFVFDHGHLMMRGAPPHK